MSDIAPTPSFSSLTPEQRAEVEAILPFLPEPVRRAVIDDLNGNPKYDKVRPTDNGHTRVSADLTIPVLDSEHRESTGLVWVEVEDGMVVHRFGLHPKWARALATDLLVAAEETEKATGE